MTAADVARIHDETAAPFFLIGELDRLLRHALSRSLDIQDVIKHCDPDGTRKINCFDDLSFGDYQRVLENPGLWATLGWPLHRATFTKRLDEIRVIRNDVMHFNPDPLAPNAVEQLRIIVKIVHKFVD